MWPEPLLARSWPEKGYIVSVHHSLPAPSSALAPPAVPSIVATVGRTPLVSLRRVVPEDHARILIKCEFLNPLSSVKDRIGVAMVEDAERSGELYPGCQIIEPTAVPVARHALADTG